MRIAHHFSFHPDGDSTSFLPVPFFWPLMQPNEVCMKNRKKLTTFWILDCVIEQWWFHSCWDSELHAHQQHASLNCKQRYLEILIFRTICVDEWAKSAGKSLTTNHNIPFGQRRPHIVHPFPGRFLRDRKVFFYFLKNRPPFGQRVFGEISNMSRQHPPPLSLWPSPLLEWALAVWTAGPLVSDNRRWEAVAKTAHVHLRPRGGGGPLTGKLL